MAERSPYPRVDSGELQQLHAAERLPLHIRWWIILPLALLLSVAQVWLNLTFEFGAPSVGLIATLISVIAFVFLLVLALVVNPLLRVTRLIQPFNRGEMMTLVASLFVSAGICTFGLVDQLVPTVATPFNEEWNTDQRGWNTKVTPFLNQDLYLNQSADIVKYRQGLVVPDNVSARGELARMGWILTNIPWAIWLKPLSLWLVFVFAIYIMFYALSMLVFDSWSRREKLVFPLARLPEDAIHDEGAEPGTISSTFKSPLFWVGFLFVFLLLSYNGACQASWIRGVSAISQGIQQDELAGMLRGTAFDGIADGAQYKLMVMIIFTAVGIGFLLPLEISASLWGYYLFGLGLLMFGIWIKLGSSVKSFSSNYIWENHYVSSLGAGGLLAYALVVLGKLVIEKAAHVQDRGRRLTSPEGLAKFLRSFGWGGVIFLASFIVSVAWLHWSHVPIHWAMAFIAVVVLVSVGIMRTVAEGGVYWFQLHVGPFHLVKAASGGKISALVAKDAATGAVTATKAAGLGPAIASLMPIYYVMFTDIKTFIAPSILNSFRMQEETRAARRWFHTIVILSIIASVAASIGIMLYYVYAVGADRSSRWFFTSGPRNLFDDASRLVGGLETTVGKWNWVFYLAGAIWVVLSVVMRRRFFWWLHPLGFAMLANPLMTHMWFSFLLGWGCKKLAVKYGGRHMFARLRPAFIGLIFGELVACFLWSWLAWHLGLSHVQIDINRYTP